MRESAPCGGLGRPLLVDTAMGESSTQAAFSVPAGTVTFLLTDVEGSTRLWEQAPAAMPGAIARHYEILDEAIGRHNGVRPVEQGEGDSVVAAFTRARDAVAAALDAQTTILAENWPAGAELRVRMALHTGDAQLRDEGNYFGAAVIRCARLRAVAHGGQVLLSGATAELVADHLPRDAELVNLGVHRLRDLGRAERVFALGHPDLPDGVPTPRSLDQLPNNLPVQTTTFVGRHGELAELDRLLASTRVLTLVGAGGCGKTRLALQLAAEALDRYPDGAWWLELAPLSDPTLIQVALASVVGVRPLPGQTSLEAAVFHLAGHCALVLLDNCEHVLDSCAELAETLLHGCEQITVVATSREPLGIGGETTWRVPSLSLPREITHVVPQSLAHSDAVGLFIERAVKVRPNFAVTNDTAPHVAQICHDLDGIPLAIELAAARVRVLSVERIAVGLADRFRLLTGGARGALPRLQTLRASVDWSHELLDEAERVLLRRLGVFHGGFTLDACEAVCAGDDLDRYAILDLLTSLVDKSLVLVEEHGRYALLETVRHYALDRLAEAGETELLRDRHAAAFLAFAEESTPRDPRWEDALAADAANLYAAVEHSADTAPDAALRLCAALGYWWVLTARLVEGDASLTRALEATTDHRTRVRGFALSWRAYLAFFAGDVDLMTHDGAEALELAQAIDDPAVEARARYVLGLRTLLSDPRAALATLERSAELAGSVGDEWCQADATQVTGWALGTMGRHEAAKARHEIAFEIAERHGFRDIIHWHWFMLGMVVYPSGDRASLRAMWERCVDGRPGFHQGSATWGLGALDIEAGRPRDALERLQPGRAQMVAAGEAIPVTFIDFGMAVAKAALGQLDDARDRLIASRQDTEVFTFLHTLVLLDLAKVEVLLGNLSDAQARVEEALAQTDLLDNDWLRARVHLRAAAVAAARAEWASAEGLVHRALVALVERGERLDVPDALDLLAEIAAGLESHAEAARLLGAADHARQTIEMVRWQPEQERAEALAARLAEALGDEALATARGEGEALSLDEAVAYVRRARGARKRPAHGWESLTPTELQVVELVAEGLTNPQIGERLFISRGTVKVHLSHVFAKLGISTRSGLASQVARRGSGIVGG